MPTNFTREQLNRANEVDLLGYVTERYPTKAHGNGTYKLQIEGHDSLVVFPNTNSWCDFNRKIGGDTVAFLTKHEGKNMVNAVRELIGETFDPQKLFDRNKALAIPKEDLILPIKPKTTAECLRI